jgi:cyclomaltodextrinase
MEDEVNIEINLKLGLWKHFKGGIYEVIGMAKHSETLDDIVVYKHQGEDKLWVRPALMFIEPMPGGGSRFQYICEK